MKRRNTTVIALLLCVLTLLPLLLLCACAAPASDPQKAMQALKDEGYHVKEKRVSGLVNFGEGLTAAFEASSPDGNLIYVLYYESADAANRNWESVKLLGESYRPQSVSEGDWVVKKNGKTVFFGTKDAAWDAS